MTEDPYEPPATHPVPFLPSPDPQLAATPDSGRDTSEGHSGVAGAAGPPPPPPVRRVRRLRMGALVGSAAGIALAAGIGLGHVSWSTGGSSGAGTTSSGTSAAS